MPTIEEFARDTIRAHVDIEMRLAERVQRLEGALRECRDFFDADNSVFPLPNKGIRKRIAEALARGSRPTSEGQKP